MFDMKCVNNTSRKLTVPLHICDILTFIR